MRLRYPTTTILATLAWLGSACAEPTPASIAPSPAHSTSTAAASPKAPPSAPPAPSAAPTASAAPPETLPTGVPLDGFDVVPVADDRPVHVAHAAAAQRRALVYLHGACGDPLAPRPWLPASREVGTLITLVAKGICKNGKKYWIASTAALKERVIRALEAVRARRGGRLDPTAVVLIGYSQGSKRAERLHAASPELFPWVVLGGMPVEPSAWRLRRVRAVALVGGEREHTHPMTFGTGLLKHEGIRARYFELPGVGHGDFGADARSHFAAVFSWLLVLDG